jgi:class 3 adenylate cyclase
MGTAMRLRTYLILSYLALIVILVLGMWGIAKRVLGSLTEKTLASADSAVKQVTEAHLALSEKILTRLGEYIVQDKAEDVARELAHVLARKKINNYAQLRADPLVRSVALQEIYTAEGPAGYTDLYDQKGYILFHPDNTVEGHNQLDWEKEFPETTELIKRSFTEDNVQGYFDFFDKDGKLRKRFSARVHVPGTPFVVAAIVNLDQYFTPTQEKIRQASQEILVRAKQEILRHHENIDLQVRFGGLLAGLVLSLLAGLSGLWFAATISRPIARLRDGVREVGEGNFAVAVPARGVREVVNLADSFNQLGQQLTEYMEKRDFIRDTFGRYVTREVVERLLTSKEAREMGGETREVSLLMSDLRGFTAITADMRPEQVIAFLNRYLSQMIEILMDHQAVIDEILGDGILAFFGAPEPMADHPARAVACALKMQEAMDGINAANEAEGLPHLEMGIGVNTGTVVVGNIGSERRTKYSVVGADVNFASRMEGYALAGQVLISEATYSRIRDLAEIRNVCQVEMKGVPGAVPLYEVRGLGGSYQVWTRERCDHLVTLSRKLDVVVSRIKDKIISGATEQAWISQLCDTAATVEYFGKLKEWEDVRLSLLDESLQPIPGHIYGKVTRVRSLEDGRFEASISFTSVAQEIYQILQQAII